MIEEGDTIVGTFTFLDHTGKEITLPRPGRAFVWWGMINLSNKAGAPGSNHVTYHSHGPASNLSASSCQTCDKSASDLLPEFQNLGIEVYGVNFREPERNYKYATKGLFTVPFLTATRETAAAFGALRDPLDPLQCTPKNVAYYLDGDRVLRMWDVRCFHDIVKTALEDIQEVYQNV